MLTLELCRGALAEVIQAIADIAQWVADDHNALLLR